jgi:hypothetical protein
MADFSEPPDKGEAYSNGLDADARRIIASLARLDERTNALGNTVTRLQGEIATLPTKSTLIALVAALIAVIGIVAIAYWNGVSGKFEAVNIKIDSLNGKLDSLSKAIERLSYPAQATPSPRGRR